MECIGLSSTRYRSNAYSVHEIHIDDAQLSWFAQQLEAIDPNTPVVVFSHAPPIGCGLKVCFCFVVCFVVCVVVCFVVCFDLFDCCDVQCTVMYNARTYVVSYHNPTSRHHAPHKNTITTPHPSQPHIHHNPTSITTPHPSKPHIHHNPTSITTPHPSKLLSITLITIYTGAQQRACQEPVCMAQPLEQPACTNRPDPFPPQCPLMVQWSLSPVP